MEVENQKGEVDCLAEALSQAEVVDYLEVAVDHLEVVLSPVVVVGYLEVVDCQAEEDFPVVAEQDLASVYHQMQPVICCLMQIIVWTWQMHSLCNLNCIKD